MKSKFAIIASSFLFVLAIFVVRGSDSFAQGLGTTTGTLSGNIQDQNGTPLPGVLVTATGPSGSKTATADVNGAFIFPYMTPGAYNVRAELQGYHTIEQTDGLVRLNLRTEVAFKLQPGQEEMVVVSGEAPTVDVSSTTTGANLSDQLLNT